MDIDAQAASVATSGEWRVRRLAVANGPNIFQRLLVPFADARVWRRLAGSLVG